MQDMQGYSLNQSAMKIVKDVIANADEYQSPRLEGEVRQYIG